MERDEFLSKLGIGAIAICMGNCLSSCGKSGPAPTEEPPATTNNPPSSNNPPTNNPPTNNPPTNNPPTNNPPTNNPPTNNPPTNNPPTNNPPTNNPPTNNPPTNNPPSSALFTVDLSSALTNVGDSRVSNGVIVARIATGNIVSSFVAVQVNCTHEGGTLAYNSSQGLFVCPLHGSVFSKTGGVVQGPAVTSLKQYTISITDSTLSVTA